MNKKLAAFVFVALLSGCNTASFGPPKLGANDMVLRCDKASPSVVVEKRTAANFAGMLDFKAFMAKGQRDTYQIKNKTLGLYDYDSGNYDIVSDCYYSNINIIKEDTANAFAIMKRATSNKDQMDALVNAYSLWEVYVNQSPTGNNILIESDMKKAIAKYKNM